jgi:hypothetical protein
MVFERISRYRLQATVCVLLLAVCIDGCSVDPVELSDTAVEDTDDNCWLPCNDSDGLICSHNLVGPPRGGGVLWCVDGCFETKEVCGWNTLCQPVEGNSLLVACLPLPPPRPETAAVNDFCYGPGEYSCTSVSECGATIIKCDNWHWREVQVCGPNERCARLSEASTVTECVAGCG